MDHNFKKDDFVFCNYYTGVQFIGRILEFLPKNEVKLEICNTIHQEKNYSKDCIMVSVDRLEPLLDLSTFQDFLYEKK